MEIGAIPARFLEVRELMNLYDVNDPELRAALEALSRDIWVKGRWDSYGRNVHVHIIDLAWLEARAEKLRNFSLPVIHGLLQTSEYAETIMRVNEPHESDERISQWLDFQMKRRNAALLHSQHPDGPVIIYTRAEWDAFLAGAKDNEFDFTA